MPVDVPVGVTVAMPGRGCVLEVQGGSLPVGLGSRDRRGSAVALGVRAQVSDCGLETQAQRALGLQVLGAGRTGLGTVDGDGAARRDRRVARTCRRTRG